MCCQRCCACFSFPMGASACVASICSGVIGSRPAQHCCRALPSCSRARYRHRMLPIPGRPSRRCPRCPAASLSPAAHADHLQAPPCDGRLHSAQRHSTERRSPSPEGSASALESAYAPRAGALGLPKRRADKHGLPTGLIITSPRLTVGNSGPVVALGDCWQALPGPYACTVM